MKLSDFELEVMHIVWERGSVIATDVHGVIAERRPVAYSTVKTIIDRLEEKGALKRSRTYGRTIVYDATVAKEELTRPMLHSFIGKLFKGNVRPLFNHALKDEKLTLEDISYLEKIVAERRKDLEND